MPSSLSRNTAPQPPNIFVAKESFFCSCGCARRATRTFGHEHTLGAHLERKQHVSTWTPFRCR
jgi:hypothetical protein